MGKRRYAVCGVSNRAIYMWIKPIFERFSSSSELVGMLDIDPLRFEVCHRQLPETKDVPHYMADEFEKMVEETKPDALLVVSMDCTHAHYIIEGLKHNLDVITEKPMTTNWEDALKVREAEKNSKGHVTCTFNYRYNPVHRKVRELVMAGKVGRVTNVDLTWYIDIKHGSSYFNRWNRMRENSGSLSIHKASHHFDLVNWWIDGVPEIVHAMGALNFYGPNGPFNPSKKDGRHCNECPEALKCGYHARWNGRASTIFAKDDHINAFETKEKLFTTYRPDMCIFDSQINIYDTFIANVKYANGALLNYSANFSTPYEGYRLAINGTHGRIETMEFGGAGGRALPNLNEGGEQFIDYFPIFEGRERFHIPQNEGGHGGGDPTIQEDVFLGVDPLRKYKILADSFDGLAAISTGDAVFKSIKSGEVIDLRKIVTK